MGEQEVGKTKKERAKYELLIILVVIVAAAVAGVGIYKARNKIEKASLMRVQLEEMRAAITTYKTLNKVNPPNLQSLTKHTYAFTPGETARPYVTNIKPDEAGKFFDPFGNPYQYDTAKGWVSSTTPGYTDW